jgi:hypothetical protein
MAVHILLRLNPQLGYLTRSTPKVTVIALSASHLVITCCRAQERVYLWGEQTDDTKLQELSFYMVEVMMLGFGIGPLLRNAIAMSSKRASPN